MAGYALKHFLNVPYIYIIPLRAGRLARFHFLLSHSLSKSGEHETIKTSKRGSGYSAAKRVFAPPCSGLSHSRERGYIIRNGKEGAGRIFPFRTDSRLPFRTARNAPGAILLLHLLACRIFFACEYKLHYYIAIIITMTSKVLLRYFVK